MLQPKMPWWKIVLIGLLIGLALAANMFILHSRAETECWVLCQPDSYVCVRRSPNKRSDEVARLECGDKFYTDGTKKNGFILCMGASTECGEAWVSKGYVVYSRPETPYFTETHIVSKGRVAARKTIGGNRRCWLKNDQAIRVYMVSDEWSVTNKGFVQTRFIELGR